MIVRSLINMCSITPAEVSELVAFYNSYYLTNRKPEEWIWQYKAYQPDKAVFTTLRDDGRLVGTQAMMPVYMKVGNKILLSGKSENTLLLPEYRGKKVMEDLFEYAVRACEKISYEFIWGFTPAIKAFRKFGFSVFPSPVVYARPGFNIVAGLASRFRQPNPIWRKIAITGKYGLNYVIHSRSLATPIVHRKLRDKVSSQIIGQSQINSLYMRLNQKFADIISPHLDDRYIDWRIRKHPFLKYGEYQAQRDGELRAYAFVVLSKGIVSISDIASDNEEATSDLLYQIIKDYSRKTGEFIILLNPEYVPGRNIIRDLREFGFYPQSTMPLVVRDLSNGRHKEIFGVANWNITGLLTEGYWM